jgi:hypothetical protein
MPAPDPLATTRLAGQPRSNPGGPPACGVAQGDLLGGRFQLGTPLGWGGQAVVFHAVATDARGQRTPLAVKVVRTDLPAAARREAAALLRWEATLLRKLRHPALPRVARFVADKHGTYLARDLVDGAPLNALLRQGPLEPRRVQALAAQLCALLRYLHTRTPPVICGDLKPANLVLRPDGTVALIDLGAAQTRTRRPPRNTRPRYGTPGYAPPEQLGGQGIDERSDLFSLAATCYELLTGIDPALTPLVFDHARLAAASPSLATALRPALEPDPARRPPTAAALHAALVRLPHSAPLALAPAVVVATRADLGHAAARHPRLLEAALTAGDAERWLADHQDAAVGRVLHQLRAERKTAPRARPLDQLLNALAPPDGSALLQPAPRQLAFGDVPLRQTRTWGEPRRLSIQNMSAEPQRWELLCPATPGAEVRVLRSGRALKQVSGVLAPGGRADLELVVAGKAGPHRGVLTLQSGRHSTSIPWEAEAKAGLPVGRRIIATLAELDPTQPGLVAALETLARKGTLGRWLRAQRKNAVAAQLDAARKAGDTLELRLLLGALLNRLSPARFPLLAIVGRPPKLKLVAGTHGYLSLLVENRGDAPFVARSGPGTTWAHCRITPPVVAPGAQCQIAITLAPPPDLIPGTYQPSIVLCAGELDLPLAFEVEVAPEAWWQKAVRWITG